MRLNRPPARSALAGASLSLVTLLFGCAPPPEAPEELSELSRYLYREWTSEDDRMLPAGLLNLEAFLDTLDLSAPIDERSFSVLPLEEEDVSDLDRPPGRSLADCAPVSIAYASRQTLDEYARLVIEADQTPAETTAPVYVRSFEPRDPSCFLDRSCLVLDTVNEVRRENLLLSVDFILYKDFRWAQIGETGRWAFLARSWFDQAWYEDGGGDVLWQSYAADIWMESEEGTVRRYQALYSETEIQGIDEDFDTRGFLADGINDSFIAADDAIDELFGD